MIKIGIIGCGKQARAHIIAIKEAGLFSIVSICDINTQQLETFNKLVDNTEEVQLTTSYGDCIDNENVQAVLIITQSNTHYQILDYAVSKNKAVLVEKPLSPNLEQLDKIIELGLISKAVVMPALEYRYSSAFCNLMNFVNSEKMGGTKYITCSEHRDNFFLPWFYDSSKSGGAILDKLIHEIDLISLLFKPSKPVSVYAVGGQDRYKEKSEITGIFNQKYILEKNDIVDNALIIVTFEDGKKVSLDLNMYQNMPVEGLQMYVAGLNGNYVQITHLNAPDLIFSHNFDGVIKNFKMTNSEDIDENGILHAGTKRMHELFYKAVTKGNNSNVKVCSWERLRNSHLIAFAAEKSIKESREIKLSEFKNPTLEKLFKAYEIEDNDSVLEYPLFEMDEIEETVKKIVNRNILRRLFRARRKVKTNILKLNKRDFNGIIRRSVKKLPENVSTSKENLTVEISLPWDNFYIDIQGNNIKSPLKMPDSIQNFIKISLSEKGYEKLASGASLNRLYITRLLQVNGNVDIAKQHQDIFLTVFNEIKAKLKR
jgi:predicted dehydrogenase